MSTFAFAVPSVTFGGGTADNVSLTTLTYLALQGGTTTQVNFVDEVYIGGQATATAPQIILLGRDSTVVGTPTALSSPNTVGLLNASGGVLTAPAVGAITGGTQATRSNSVSLAKKIFTFNAFGGTIARNYANTSDRFGIIGNTASLGEVSLSSFTGTTAAACSAHLLFETMGWFFAFVVLGNAALSGA